MFQPMGWLNHQALHKMQTCTYAQLDTCSSGNQLTVQTAHVHTCSRAHVQQFWLPCPRRVSTLEEEAVAEVVVVVLAVVGNRGSNRCTKCFLLPLFCVLSPCLSAVALTASLSGPPMLGPAVCPRVSCCCCCCSGHFGLHQCELRQSVEGASIKYLPRPLNTPARVTIWQSFLPNSLGTGDMWSMAEAVSPSKKAWNLVDAE